MGVDATAVGENDGFSGKFNRKRFARLSDDLLHPANLAVLQLYLYAMWMI